MNRRTFLTAAAAAAVSSSAQPAVPNPSGKRLREIKRPLAITMWDFSWLERRWPGAGYEDWDRILDQLAARGYNAVRIDAFPHLVAAAPDREWELIPVWSVQDWGSPAKNRVQVQPALNRFIRKCADRNMRVALSTWFRQDTGNTRMHIHTPR
ncbi:MAG: cellulase-like family protein, partial [Bryobacteraceae bacterium]